MKHECMNCNNQVEWEGEIRPIWCSIKCKKEFYVKYFAGNSDVRLWEYEYNEDFKESQKRVMEEIKKSGLTVTEYIRGLGDFKEDAVNEHLNEQEKENE